MTMTPADLRAAIRRHLKAHPGLTGFEVSRAIGAAEASVKKQLRAMEADGEAEPETTPKGPDICNAVTRWRLAVAGESPAEEG